MKKVDYNKIELIKFQRICKGRKIIIEAANKEEADKKLYLLLKK